jgi:microcystin-dependent protein
MPIDFPSSPTTNQTYTYNNKLWVFNGSAWVGGTAASQLPSGSMQMYAGAVTQTVSAGVVTTTSPSGWLLANGNAVSRTTYSALFTAIGTTYGTGDGSTTFNLPDLRSRMPMGSGTGVGLNSSGTGVTSGTAMTARALGAWFGEETHLLTTSEMPSHNHTANTGSAGSHSHTPAGSIGNVGLGTNNLSVAGGSQWGFTSTATITNTVANHQHPITAEGGGSRHSVVPPVLVMNFIIKT